MCEILPHSNSGDLVFRKTATNALENDALE